MRRSLGRIIVWFVIFHTTLWGMSYRWSVLESPQSLRVGQSGVIRYACTFEGSAAEYSTKLKLVDTPQYGTSVLSQNTRVVQGKRIDTIDLLITPKTAGVIEIRMKADVRYTSPGAVENTVLGRDNLSRDDISEEEVALPGISIRSQENSAALTGNITMEAQVDRTSVRAHEPLHLSVIIKGSGNLEQFIPYELNISGVKVFSEPAQKLFTPSSDGVEGEIRQEFALVAEKSYVIPTFKLSVFDTAHNRAVLLQSAPIQVEINEGYDPASLLDAPDLTDMSTLKHYAYNIGLVILGVIFGEAGRVLWKRRPRRKTAQFWERSKNTKELILMLALSGDKRYEAIITALESNTISLSEAKKKLSTLTTEKEVKA
ncbi:MAG: hypothetical protein PHI47_13165 [Sulfuricurvum sp.]|uniref:hypothetical protein n=1 Tax=Sulfuricurvum sp. TaxID=2025608 RepID=UPI002613759D|nr:hypothetical protein [Sulfuricurvum sp.]MDD5160997.1 hypothetical protein [Sulfuricurvum sp.]